MMGDVYKNKKTKRVKHFTKNKYQTRKSPKMKGQKNKRNQIRRDRERERDRKWSESASIC
jgi:uncharacterized protein YaiL (DUF2058 family)